MDSDFCNSISISFSSNSGINEWFVSPRTKAEIALRNAANAIGNLKDTHLSNFFNKIAYRKGRTVAVSATARKLAVIIWNMIVKKIPYKPPTGYLFLDEKRKLGLVDRIRKQISKFELTIEDLGIATS